MKTVAPFALAFALLLSACSTLGSFQDMDDNQDGSISRDESNRSEPLAALFNSADDNKDGVLDEEEYDIVHQAILQNRGATTRERRKMMTERGGP